MAHAIERELIKVTKYKPRAKFDDRQDYLSSILNSVMKLTDDDFDNLSDEAASWANSAVEAHNSKEEIPDFDEVEAAADGEAASEADDSDEPQDDDADDQEADDDAAEDADDQAEDSGDSDQHDSDPDDAADDADDDDDAEGDDDPEAGDAGDAEDDLDEDEPAPAPKKKTAPKQTTKYAKGSDDKPPSVKAFEKAKAKVKRPVDDEEDVVLDKWGCMEGSKNSRALALFEKGRTAKEVKDELGGTYYNIMKKMVEDGHTLEKNGAVITIIHKDEKPSKKAKK